MLETVDLPERLAGLVAQVWQALPLADCNKLAGVTVGDMAHHYHDAGLLACIFGTADRDNGLVLLNCGKLETVTDAIARAVIAHELAHLALKHRGCDGVVVIEGAAWRLAEAWGFCHGLSAREYALAIRGEIDNADWGVICNWWFYRHADNLAGEA